MKILSALVLVVSLSAHAAEEKMKMYFNNEELTKVIEMYSKASGQKFVVDSTVRGKVSMFNQEAVSLTEAFNQLSTALALNGFAISKQDDTMVVRNARSVQRAYITVSSEKPSLQPERMYTWVYTAKNIPVKALAREGRIFTASYGEYTVNEEANQIIITDFTTSLNRVADLLKEMDVKPSTETTKLVAMSKKQMTEFKKEKAEKQIKETKAEKTDE